jgi:hypothetical protein
MGIKPQRGAISILPISCPGPIAIVHPIQDEATEIHGDALR